MFWKKFIGDRKFYRTVLSVAVPMMIQSGITSFVNLLDNIMVGRLGTEEMSGVSIVNQFVFIFNLVVFGALSAAGIFTAQFHGSRDTEGEKYTFRFKFIITVLTGLAASLLFIALDDELISTFLHSSTVEGNLELTLSYGKQYLFVAIFGLVPYALSQVYSSTLRETGEVIIPMVSSSTAVITNAIFNLIFIFGHLGFPAMGVRGAALATVISRFIELFIVVIYTHTHKAKHPFIIGAYSSLRIPKHLFNQIVIRGLPLMANEFFWSCAITLRNQCYSTRGLEVVAAQNIQSTVCNLFSVIYMSIGSSIAIIVGNLLGAGKLEEAKDSDRKMMAFSVMVSTFIAAIIIAFSQLFPSMYNTSDTVKSLAAQMIIITAISLPFCAFAHSAYFTLRSGGKVFITLLFDSVFMWVLVVPLSLILAHFTNIGIIALFAICQSTEIIKVVFGYALLKKGTWVKQLVADDNLKK